MRNLVIGIAGKAGVGKDTVASIISYIHKVGVANADYRTWLTFRNTTKTFDDARITHFADSVKDALAATFAIPREKFENQEFKNEHYLLIPELIVKPRSVVMEDTDRVIIDKVTNNPFTSTVAYKKAISIRKLMQWYATEFIRDNIDKNIWVKSCISRARDIVSSMGICIIPDVRFDNEKHAINKLTYLYPSLYGEVIVVESDKFGSNNQDNHISETTNFDVTHVIHNNTTLMALFYKVLRLLQTLFQHANKKSIY